jgi:tRNA threonylcarbamoyladenosine biosynthesis protein TsaB
MLILLMDTAFDGTHVTVHDSARGVIASERDPASYGQGDILIPMVERVMAAAGVDYGALSRIAVTKGPGAFTGLRIGLAAARGYRLALKIPVVGICCFDAVLETYALGQDAVFSDNKTVAVILETKRKDYYVRLYKGRDALSLGAVMNAEELQLRLKELGDVLLVGDAVNRFKEESGGSYESHLISYPSSAALAKLAVVSQDDDLSPVYLRPPEVMLPKSLESKISSQ